MQNSGALLPLIKSFMYAKLPKNSHYIWCDLGLDLSVMLINSSGFERSKICISEGFFEFTKGRELAKELFYI